jgi:hypothetical protein
VLVSSARNKDCWGLYTELLLLSFIFRHLLHQLEPLYLKVGPFTVNGPVREYCSDCLLPRNGNIRYNVRVWGGIIKGAEAATGVPYDPAPTQLIYRHSRKQKRRMELHKLIKVKE